MKARRKEAWLKLVDLRMKRGGVFVLFLILVTSGLSLACALECIDSANGSAYQKGTARGTLLNGTYVVMTDSCINFSNGGEVAGCSSGILTGVLGQCGIKDYSCKFMTDSQYHVDAMLFACPNGCADGACLTSNPDLVGTCTDSDGGKNYYVRGDYLGYYGGTYHMTGTESCVALDLAGTVNASNYLGEAYCEDNQLNYERYTCPNGCSNGVCITSAPKCTENWSCGAWSDCNSNNKQTRICTDQNNCGTITNKPTTSQSCSGNSNCTDSDGGKNYYVRGKATSCSSGTWGSGCAGLWDMCINSNILSEEYCDGTTPVNINFTCPNGCGNGACLVSNPVPTINCADSDNGSNIYFRGTVTGTWFNDKTSQASGLSDFCSATGVVQEYSCQSRGDGTYGVVQTGTTCPDGYSCSDGACIAVSPVSACEGCELNNKCYSLGYRLNGSYCADGGNFIAQKEKSSTCDNSFECTSNVCVDNQCISQSLIDRIIEWIRKLFGNGPPKPKPHSDLIYQPVKFFIDPAVISNLTAEKVYLSEYVQDLTAIYSKTTNRRFTFDPETGINLTTKIDEILSTLNYCECNYTSGNFSVLVFIQKANSSLGCFYGGHAGLSQQGDGVIAGFHWLKIYDPNNLSSIGNEIPGCESSLNTYRNIMGTMSHELAHTYGVAAGNEYYHLTYIDDATNIEPLVNVDIRKQENDSYWGEHTEYLNDPMLTAGCGHNTNNRQEFLDCVKFSPLSSKMITLGIYRNKIIREATSVPDMSNVGIKITDMNNSTLSGADVKIWEATEAGSYPNVNLILFAENFTDRNGELRFDWIGARRRSFGATNFVDYEIRLIKVYKQGYTPQAKYVSLIDAQEARVLRNETQWTINIKMFPAS